MIRLARVRKLAIGALGFAVSLAVLIPPESPSKMREVAAAVIAVASLFGVYQVKNAPPPAAAPLLTRRVRASDRPPPFEGP